MIAEMVSNQSILDEIVFISCITTTVGGVWSAVLGYLLLDLLGWRFFILLTSLPVFVPPILMLHFCFVNTAGPQVENEENQTIEKEVVIVPNFLARTIKLGLYSAISTFQGWLTILLVPTLIQMLKIKEAEPNSDCSVTVTQGWELLLLGLVTFAAIIGRFFIHHMRKRVSFRKLQVVVALLNVASFAAMLAQHNLPVVVVTNFIVKILYGITAMTYNFILYDIGYFGTARFALGSSVALAIGLFGGVAGTAMVAFVPLFAVIITALVLSAIEIFVVLSMTEVE